MVIFYVVSYQMLTRGRRHVQTPPKRSYRTIQPRYLYVFLKENGYVLSKIHISTVAGWFGNCVLAVFERDGVPVLTFDTIRNKILP